MPIKDEDKEVKNRFKTVRKIGQGGYGSVYMVEKQDGVDKNAIYAMKVSVCFALLKLLFAETTILKFIDDKQNLLNVLKLAEFNCKVAENVD